MTEHEPNYEYVKGEGWVPSYGKFKYLKDGFNRTWLVKTVNREPGYGEYWDSTHNFEGYDINGSNPLHWNNWDGSYKLHPVCYFDSAV